MKRQQTFTLGRDFPPNLKLFFLFEKRLLDHCGHTYLASVKWQLQADLLPEINDKIKETINPPAFVPGSVYQQIAGAHEIVPAAEAEPGPVLWQRRRFECQHAAGFKMRAEP